MTIPLEVLQSVRVVVSHRYPENACADGLASAMIIKDVLPDVEYRFFAHNTRAYDELVAEPGMLFVDITPPMARVTEFRERGAIVLDHHKDREELVASFGERGVFAHEARDPGVSGALLAFEHVWMPFYGRAGIRSWQLEKKRIRHFAEVAGVRDTWQRSHPLWKTACEQAAVLLFFPIEDWLDGEFEPLDPERLAQRMDLGPHLIARFQQETATLVKSAYAFTTEKFLRVVVLPSVRISDAAELFASAADVVVGFSFHVEDGKPSMRMSFRSFKGHGGKSVDVSEIARIFPGGGGHKHAAGGSMRLDNDHAQPHPYVFIRALMESF